jgi:hypothetical protein
LTELQTEFNLFYLHAAIRADLEARASGKSYCGSTDESAAQVESVILI